MKKEADAWGLIDPLCHSWTGPSGSSLQDFPTLISRRQLCVTNSLKCQRINVKAEGSFSWEFPGLAREEEEEGERDTAESFT